MGGAERRERQRRREEALRRAARTSSSKGRAKSSKGSGPGAPPTRTVDRARVRKVALGIGATAVVVAVVIGGLVWLDADKNATEGQAIDDKAGTQVDEQRDGAVVVVGSPKAKVTIDIYADFLCPACGAFEQRYAKAIAARVEAGDLRVRQHMVPLLNKLSDPPGYSGDAANAALCAADGGKFTAFHDSLFAAQPEEGKRGWDKGQLTKLGRDLGLGGDFPECVASNRYAGELDASLEAADKEIPKFGTPTVIGPDGTRIDWNNPEWLNNLFA